MPSAPGTPADKALGPIVLWLRRAAGLTQKDVSESMKKAGHATWSQTLVSRLELDLHGGRRVSISEFIDLMDILGADHSDIIGWLRR